MGLSVEQMRKIYDASTQHLSDLKGSYEKSVDYYNGNNDIMRDNDMTINDYKNKTDEDGMTQEDDPLHKAKNRVSSNFYQIMVDQEAGYLATHEPTFDVGDDKDNNVIKEMLGDSLSLTVQNLIIDTSNAGIGWLHYWIDDNNNFKFGIVTPEQIYPIYSDNLENDLVAVERIYRAFDEEAGKYRQIVEYWNSEACTSFVVNDNNSLDEYNNVLTTDNSTNTITGSGNVYNHPFGRVPFIKFRKNKYEKPELAKVKGSIDIYDKVYCGFANDLEDIQQTLMVLKDYGGTDLDEFMNELRKHKAIKVDDDGDVNQLQIEIPVEARQTMLELTKQKIFDEGQAIDPEKFMDNGALSGKAIKGLYAHLDLKATTTEKNFRQGFAVLIRAMLKFKGASDYETRNISQTWTKNAIQDELEKAQAIAQLAPYMSEYAIANANPFVDDVQAEIQHKKDESVDADGYGNQSKIDELAGSDNDE